jgi:protein Tex
MSCPGIVTNVTNFGAFVDIGIHQDGLVHLSQLANRFVRDPREVVNPGDRVVVRVMEVNADKKQISLTMKEERPAAAPKPRRPRPQADKARPKGDRPRRPEGPRTQDRAAKGQGASANPRPSPGKRPPKPQGPRRPRPPSRPELTHNPFAALAVLKEKK